MAEELQQQRVKVQQLEATRDRLQPRNGVQRNAAETGLSAMGWPELVTILLCQRKATVYLGNLSSAFDPSFNASAASPQEQ
ncbi:hypothetical protein WMY93_026474 [Mugilogobius chulae]|uniref:Uncharacterized protein n=1 Tax=Mugilogobius chulae TaxID=88201 RepID=A0AAW0N232_9GOBI